MTREYRVGVGAVLRRDDGRVNDPKSMLHRYLQSGRDALIWKLEGLSDFEMRRPMTSTGTNLLGIVKHVASIEVEYFTKVFGRPCPVELPWFDDGASPNADMWATADESLDFIVGLYRESWRVSDVTITELELDAPGHVPWWGEARRDTTLQTILVHMIAETHRHAGHMDIVREMIDGERGWNQGSPNLPSFDSSQWSRYVEVVTSAAESFRGQ